MKLCLDCGRDISMRWPTTKRCVHCATKTKAKSKATVAQQRVKRERRRAWRALQAIQHDEATCPDCHTSLFDVPIRCAIGQKLHDERIRAEQARAKKPAALSARAQEDAARIERQLAALAARRRRQRMTLTDEDCWAGAGSMAGAWEGAEL